MDASGPGAFRPWNTAGQISAQLASDHGNSQLNLGFLTQPKSRGYGEPRGQGAELRSDQKVAVRGVQGVLISAEVDGGAKGTHLDRAELIRISEEVARLAQQLCKLAERNACDGPATSEIAELASKLKQLDVGCDPIVAISGPAGVAVTSGQSLALGAVTSLNLVSSGDGCLDAGGAAAIRTGKGLSMFAHQGGMKLVAAAGAVKFHAQDDGLEVLARKVLDIISTTDWINIKAKNGVRINGGGTELVLSKDGILGFTSGKHEMHAADHQTMKGQSKDIKFPGMSTCANLAAGAAQSGESSVSLTNSQGED